MKFSEWIREKFFNKPKAIEEPKKINTISPQEQFRNECATSAQISDEEKMRIAREKERERQIRFAGYNILNNYYNMDSEEIKRELYEKLNQSRTTQEPIEMVLSDLDIVAIKDLNDAVQRNPKLVDYLNGMNFMTKDNNIILVIERMETEAKQVAKNYGYNEQYATNFIGTTSNRIIAQLQEEQTRNFEERQSD